MPLILVIEDTPKSQEALQTLELPYRKAKFESKLHIGPYKTMKECIEIETLLSMDDIHTWKIQPY